MRFLGDKINNPVHMWTCASAHLGYFCLRVSVSVSVCVDRRLSPVERVVASVSRWREGFAPLRVPAVVAAVSDAALLRTLSSLLAVLQANVWAESQDNTRKCIRQ